MKAIIFHLCLLCILSSCPVLAMGLSIKGAKIRESIPGATVSAAYFKINNHSSSKKTLLSATSPIAKVEIHRTQMKNGLMEMEEIPFLDIEAGDSITFEPGKIHLMLIDLKKQLKAGEKIQIQLKFKDQTLPTWFTVTAF